MMFGRSEIEFKNLTCEPHQSSLIFINGKGVSLFFDNIFQFFFPFQENNFLFLFNL